ncbi:GTPase Era [bacterium]|nr:GTPase Era [bacterium]
MPNTKPNNAPVTSSVFVALVGRPNVGKSSLTNHLVGEKVAIVTQKPQTTRNRITGIITKGPVQYVLLDTPGIHKPRNRLDSRMTQTAAASLKDVDVTLMLFEPAGAFTDSELNMVEALRKAGPAIAVINKVDLLTDFATLEARKKQVEAFDVFDSVTAVSAKDGTGCEALFPLLGAYANPGPHYFDDEAFTDMPEKELVAELVREKALLYMRDEIPHGIAVTVESFKERPDRDLIDIQVEICCERKSHKGMIIGKGGQMLKKIASAARLDCEELLGARVNLQCWVKVREDWRDNDRMLDNLGFAKP